MTDISHDTLIIVNPAAARASRLWTDLRLQLQHCGVGFDEHVTTHRGDAETRTRQALHQGYRVIAAAGGDGTLSEVAAGFFTYTANNDTAALAVNTHAALAILPAGTGDDFARGLAGTRLPLSAWVERLARYCAARRADTNSHTLNSMTCRVDVLDGKASTQRAPLANRFICLNAATLGIGAEVAARVARQEAWLRRASGELRFAAAALGALLGWRARAVQIKIDDELEFECETNLLAVMNNRFAGGGMMFAPAARPDDKRFDVVTTDRLTRRVLLRELTRIHRGGHIANPAVRITQGTRVLIKTKNESDVLFVEADGDIRGHTPIEFRLLPAALRVVI